MPDAGFFAQKRNSPAGFGLVVLLHAALIAAVVLIRSPAFQRIRDPITQVRLIPIAPDPRPVPRPLPQHDPHPLQPQHDAVDHIDRLVRTDQGTTTAAGQGGTAVTGDAGAGTTVVLPPPPPPAPVRHAAEFDPRYASALQPPYPGSEQRAGREGHVQVRVTIGPDGRVTAVARLSATSEAFWEVTRQQALSRWRFRPATVDGRPVEDSKVLNLTFRLVDNG